MSKGGGTRTEIDNNVMDSTAQAANPALPRLPNLSDSAFLEQFPLFGSMRNSVAQYRDRDRAPETRAGKSFGEEPACIGMRLQVDDKSATEAESR